MDNERREWIRSQAKGLVLHIDETQLELLRTHIAIHKRMLRALESRGISKSKLKRMGFATAADQLFGSRVHRDLRSALKMLNDARNVIAHEEYAGDIFIKLAELGRLIKGPSYIESPPTVEVLRAQTREILHFLYAWAAYA